MTQPVAVTRYKKKNIRQFNINLNRVTDADLVELLESKPNRQGYIKELLRADLEGRVKRD